MCSYYKQNSMCNMNNMNNLQKSLILLVILGIIGIAYYIYRTNTYITAEFKHLRPFHTRAPIYYNGFKIGRVVKVRPNKTYTATIVTMELHPGDLHLPINIIANLKKEKDYRNNKYDYIDIIYPKSPSMFLIKDGDRIAGKSTVELETYLANMDQESLDAIKADMAETVKNLNITVQTLGDLFSSLNSMVSDVRPNVVKASSDLKDSTSNFVRISEKVDDTVDSISNVTGNIDGALTEDRMNSTAKNFHATSKNVRVMTNELNKTIPQIGCTITQVNRVLCNVEEMTSGLNCTMKKPFGGFRLMFGRPISKKNCGCKTKCGCK